MADIDVTEYRIGENTYHYRDGSVLIDLNNKVDKVEGYSLVSNTEITKLAGIEAQANKTVVDSALSGTSENPVQNKVVHGEIENLKRYATISREGLVRVGESLTIDSENAILNINNLATISPVLEEGDDTVEIATFTDNAGNEGSIYAPVGGGGGEGDLNAIELTKAQYDALPMGDKIDETKVYFITDYTPGGASLGWGRGTLEEIVTYTASGAFTEWGVGDRIDYNFSATKSTLNPSLEDRQIICQGVKAYIVDANDDYVEDVDFFLTKAYNTEVSNAQTYKVDGYILNTSSSAYSLPLKVKYEIEIMYV